MLLLLVWLAQADSGDTSPYVDSDAKAELTYTQKDGCGGNKAFLLLLPISLLLAPLRRS